MKDTLQPYAALRFQFLSNASHAVGDKWAGHGGPRPTSVVRMTQESVTLLAERIASGRMWT